MAESFEFQFVNSTISSPVVPQDLAIRALIRKQAMKKASAARKRNGNYGKHNLRQYPVFIDQNHKEAAAVLWDGEKNLERTTQRLINTNDDTKQAKGKEKWLNKSERRHEADRERWLSDTLPMSISPKGYRLVSSQLDFDLLNLSTLATLHIGRAVRGALSQNPNHILHQLRSHKRWSYLNFIQSRYSHIECLKDATDCVMARARQIISPGGNWEPIVIASYVKALDSLQKALDCPKQRYQPEVLCATEILSLYELLDPSGEAPWIRHTAGAAKLILVRGPKNYNTEFEQALFLAMTVPIMTECLLNGERCFLEQQAWQEVMKSIIDKEESPISDRSEIVLSLLMLKCRIPGFCYEVTDIICVAPDPDVEAIEDLAIRLRQLRTNFLNWRSRYQSIVGCFPEMSPGCLDYDSHCKVWANFLSCLIITTRLLEALCAAERPELEQTTESLITQMFQLELETRNSPTSLFMAQTFAVAQATNVTSDDWKEVKPVIVDDQPDTKGLIERSKFERWNKMIGRKLP